jgi:hypothetical protein
VTYKVVTHTSDLRGAGTDAAVYVQLHGLFGDGLRQQLVGGPTDFSRYGCRASSTKHHHHHHHVTQSSHSINAIGPAPLWSAKHQVDGMLLPPGCIC